ncbi:hypothetical protein LBMAG42_20760 [Deltaproteobacteria bacterium]|nr:hypothetical protein LBMAG42_20760 [Deltaproteobacteria bacterium]
MVGVGWFSVEEEGSDHGRSLVRELEQTVADAPEFLPVLEAHFDVDAILGALAVDLVIANEDGYARNANNFLLYHEAAFNRWWLFPWGIDRAFTDERAAALR